jgi:hypothetical protein
MKIEIGESLMLSYLKYVKKCIFYQSNWKSSNNWAKSNSEKVQNVYNKINENLVFDVLKKSNLDQLIKQAEIDVIGMDADNNIYAIDIAFHENGLNYGSKDETKNRVLKKLLRSYLALLSYFPDKSYQLIFVSPKVHDATEKIIQTYFSELVDNFSDENVKFKYISNDMFRDEIVIPTINNSSDDSDTNELFLRAVKMLDLFDLYSDQRQLNENIENKKLYDNNNIEQTKQNLKNNQTYNQNNSPVKEYYINGINVDKSIFEEKLRNNICQVKVTLYYNDKKPKEKKWNVKNFTENTSLDGNINSGYLRGWLKKGINKIRLEL